MEGGEYLPHYEEQEIVLKIFVQYAQGTSYKLIAEELTLTQVPYLPEKKTWNKNMVARILQNETYKGNEKYPALLTNEQWNATQGAMKTYTKTVSPEIKQLKPLIFCGLCGGKVERKLTPQGKERWRCTADLKHISVACTDQSILEQVKKMKEENKIYSAKDFVNKKVSMEILELEKNFREKKELSSDKRKEILHAIAQLKYQMCDTQVVTKDRKFQEWLDNIENMSLKENKITEIVTKDGSIIRNEG